MLFILQWLGVLQANLRAAAEWASDPRVLLLQGIFYTLKGKSQK